MPPTKKTDAEGTEAEAEAEGTEAAEGTETESTATERRSEQGRLDPPPAVTVLGHIDGNVALKLHWVRGMHVISNQRFKFMREELDIQVNDEPEEYLF